MNSLLAENSVDKVITSRILLKLLQSSDIWKEKVSFLPQPGESYLVCDKTISVAEVLKELSKYQSKDTLQEDDIAKEESDDAVVHKAVGILRKRMEMTKKMDKEYFSPDEVTVEGQRKFIDPLLYKAVEWLCDKALHGNASTTESHDEKILSIARDIVFHNWCCSQ